MILLGFLYAAIVLGVIGGGVGLWAGFRRKSKRLKTGSVLCLTASLLAYLASGWFALDTVA